MSSYINYMHGIYIIFFTFINKICTFIYTYIVVIFPTYFNNATRSKKTSPFVDEVHSNYIAYYMRHATHHIYNEIFIKYLYMRQWGEPD